MEDHERKAYRQFTGSLKRALESLEESLAQDPQEDAEQLRVQLAGCAVAALGGTQEPARKGDYGWSGSYQDVLQLRQDHDAFVQKVRSAMEPTADTYMQKVAVEKALVDLDRARGLIGMCPPAGVAAVERANAEIANVALMKVMTDPELRVLASKERALLPRTHYERADLVAVRFGRAFLVLKCGQDATYRFGDIEQFATYVRARVAEWPTTSYFAIGIADSGDEFFASILGSSRETWLREGEVERFVESAAVPF